MRIGQIADQVERAGDRLASTDVEGVDPGATAFGADHPGRLGELGRTLHQRFSAAVTARSREATAHGARLGDSAELVRVAVRRYGTTESAARSRHDIEGQ